MIWAGKKWEVIRELVFANDLINHFKYLAALFNEGDEEDEGDDDEEGGEENG